MNRHETLGGRSCIALMSMMCTNKVCHVCIHLIVQYQSPACSQDQSKSSGACVHTQLGRKAYLYAEFSWAWLSLDLLLL